MIMRNISWEERRRGEWSSKRHRTSAKEASTPWDCCTSPWIGAPFQSCSASFGTTTAFTVANWWLTTSKDASVVQFQITSTLLSTQDAWNQCPRHWMCYSDVQMLVCRQSTPENNSHCLSRLFKPLSANRKTPAAVVGVSTKIKTNLLQMPVNCDHKQEQTSFSANTGIIPKFYSPLAFKGTT